MNDIELMDIYESVSGSEAITLLYKWLGQRTPQESISHKTMPSMKEHTDFIFSHPYHAWYIIKAEGRYVGSIYITKSREVGIHIDIAERGKGYGSMALQTLRTLWKQSKHTGALLANINPRNHRSIAFFKRHGATLLQHTYKMGG